MALQVLFGTSTHGLHCAVKGCEVESCAAITSAGPLCLLHLTLAFQDLMKGNS